MSYIKIENVRKTFDGKVDVLKNINLEVREGELLTLLGPSGCGKSTLLRAIAGFNDIDGGAIYIDGKDVTGVSPGKRNLGMVFQAYSLFPNMTVFDNVAYGLKIKGTAKENITEAVSKIIDQVGLSGREKSLPAELSGGQQQRVALARALVTKPKVLLLDEPLSAIDPKLRKSLQEQIRDIQKSFNITTIFVTHDQAEAFVVSDRVAVMHDGKILQIAEPIEIYTKPADEFVASFIGNYNLMSPDIYKALTGNETTTTRALRPEVIRLSQAGFNGYINSPGKIVDVIPKGNIIGYNVLVKNHILKVDLILDDTNIYKVGSDIIVSINENDLIEL